jgi:MMP 1-O-methyltransferase
MQPDALRSKVTQALADVDGWLFLDEAWALHESVRNLARPGQPVTVVEIGSFKGRSTIALALGVKARGSGTVFAIDPHTGAGTPIGPVATAVEFQRNIAAAGVDKLVELLVTTSHAARPQFAAKSIDLLFVDGSHEYEDLKTDITDWQTALKDESVVAFNDPCAPGVYRALRELVVRSRTAYRNPVLVSNTLFFKFRRSEPWKLHDELALVRLRTVLRLKFRATPLWPYIPAWLVWTARNLSRKIVGPAPGA